MVPVFIPFVPGTMASEATNLLAQFEFNGLLNTMLEVILIADHLSKIFIDKNRNYSDAGSRKIF